MDLKFQQSIYEIYYKVKLINNILPLDTFKIKPFITRLVYALENETVNLVVDDIHSSVILGRAWQAVLCYPNEKRKEKWVLDPYNQFYYVEQRSEPIKILHELKYDLW